MAPRLSPLAACLLLAFGGAAPALSQGDGERVQVRAARDRVIDRSARPDNITGRRERDDGIDLVAPLPDGVTEHVPLPGRVRSSASLPERVLRFDATAPPAMRSPHDPHWRLGRGAPLALELTTGLSATSLRMLAPDDRPLWRLLEQRRYEELRLAIERLRRTNAGWQAPAQLLRLARDAELAARVSAALTGGDMAALPALVATYPEAFGCQRIDAGWEAARLLAGGGQPAQSQALVAILMQCPDAADRLATLHKARDWLPGDAWLELLAQEAGRPRDAVIDAEYRTLVYHVRVAQLAALEERRDVAGFTAALETLAGEIVARRDAAAALLGGWTLQAAGQHAMARTWFVRALDWADEAARRDDAHRGLALLDLRDGDPAAALTHAEALGRDAEGRDALLQEAHLALARRADETGAPAQALLAIGRASAHGALPRHGRLLQGWVTFRLGQAREAATVFADLYREEADLAAAEGALASLVAAGLDADLRRLAASEPLAGLVRRRDADQAFAARRYLRARSLDPVRYGDTGMPALLGGAGVRSKSGDAGQSRLVLRLTPVLAASVPVGGDGELQVRVDRVDGDAGRLAAGAPVGGNPAGNIGGGRIGLQGWAPLATYRRERDDTVTVSFGSTPFDGAVPATPLFRVERQDAAGDIMAVYREALRESLLSLSGLRDPAGGPAWGRVTRNGVSVAMERGTGGWSAGAVLRAEYLDGRRVASNRRFGGGLHAAAKLAVPGFDHVVAGLHADAEAYRRNLAHFTAGHGGYFSPQRYWRAGAFLQFSTPDMRRWILQGRLSAGRSGKREQAAPWFPLRPDGRAYPALAGTGVAWDADLAAIWQAAPHWQLGMQLTRRSSPQYDDTAAVVVVRYLLDPQPAATSRDLPSSLAKELF